ncbi:CvpA family protein [Agathobacter sp.]
MNWLLIAVICIIAWNVVRGYSRGLLRIVYSLVAWVVMLGASMFAAPYVRDCLAQNTQLEQVIYDKVQQQVTGNNLIPAGGDYDIAGVLLQKSGVYDEISTQITSAIMTGISFFIVMLVLGIAAYAARRLIWGIEKVPVIGTVNRIAGFGVGFIKGMIIVWVLLAVIALGSTSGFGQTMTPYIDDSSLLRYIYENNPVLNFILGII